MTASHIRRQETLESVHTSESDWVDVVRGWTKNLFPEEDEESRENMISQMIEAVEQTKVKPWLVYSVQGIQAFHPADYLTVFEDIAASDTLDEVWGERRKQGEKGYTYAHDDVHGLGHLISEAVVRVADLSGKEDAEIRRRLVQSAAILVAAVDLIDRKESKQRSLPTFYDTAAVQKYEQQWIARVGEYMHALADLAGQAQDEEDSTPEEAIGWATEQFQQIFDVKENDQA